MKDDHRLGQGLELHDVGLQGIILEKDLVYQKPARPCPLSGDLLCTRGVFRYHHHGTLGEDVDPRPDGLGMLPLGSADSNTVSIAHS